MAKKQADAPGGKGASYAVEMVAIELLSEDPANARKHGDKNVDAIVASLRRFGQQKPIVIDQNNVVRAGNGTLQAARVLGWQSIACYRSELAGAEMAAYAIADNRTAELAEWDEEILRATLEGLAVDDVELLEAAGYDESELSQLLAEINQSQSGNEQKEKPELEISPELHERQDYIVIVFDNEFDWIVATQMLGITTEKSAKVETSTIEKTGVGRVITSQKFLKAIES